MPNSITQLPDHILCHILSLLPLRDAARTRSLVYKWRFLHDVRSNLLFDSYNVMGKQICCFTDDNRCKFVAAIDQFMQLWCGTKISILHINFDLGKEHTSHINRWIQFAIQKGVEKIDLNFIRTDANREGYSFPYVFKPCSLDSLRLKCLRLNNCKLDGYYHRNLTWLSQIITLELSRVPLKMCDILAIFAGGLNLTSVRLYDCCLPTVVRINGSNCLKNLTIDELERSLTMKLNCPNLESFKFCAKSGKLIFFHVPKLRKMDLWFSAAGSVCSRIFDDLTRNVPQLEALSLSMRTNVIPPIVRDVSRSLLRKLELKVDIPLNFDVLTIFNMLDICPSLEILHLKLSPWLYNTERQQRRSYGYYTHAALKEVKIEGINLHLMMLVPSLLQTAVALRQIIIITRTSNTKRLLTNFLQEHINNNNVEFIIKFTDF